jgi:uncharacterized membrane protein
MTKAERATVTLVVSVVGIAALKAVATQAGAELQLTPIEVALLVTAASLAIGALLQNA